MKRELQILLFTRLKLSRTVKYICGLDIVEDNSISSGCVWVMIYRHSCLARIKGCFAIGWDIVKEYEICSNCFEWRFELKLSSILFCINRQRKSFGNSVRIERAIQLDRTVLSEDLISVAFSQDMKSDAFILRPHISLTTEKLSEFQGELRERCN